MVESPCKNKCKLVNDKCIGCGRSIQEITKWIKLSDEQKLKIIQRINSDN
jgi:predicted Fe-S protein YdhL (DUF1289 family)